MSAWPLVSVSTRDLAPKQVLIILKRLLILTLDDNTYFKGHAYNISITWMILMNDIYPVWSQSKIKLFYPSVKINHLYLV